MTRSWFSGPTGAPRAGTPYASTAPAGVTSQKASDTGDGRGRVGGAGGTVVVVVVVGAVVLVAADAGIDTGTAPTIAHEMAKAAAPVHRVSRRASRLFGRLVSRRWFMLKPPATSAIDLIAPRVVRLPLCAFLSLGGVVPEGTLPAQPMSVLPPSTGITAPVR